MTQNNLETTSVDSPPTNDSDFHFTAKLRRGDPLGLPWEVLHLLLLELSPSWLWVAIIQSHLYSIVHKFFIIPVPSMTLFHVFKAAMDLVFFLPNVFDTSVESCRRWGQCICIGHHLKSKAKMLLLNMENKKFSTECLLYKDYYLFIFCWSLF